jgi:hypothetical protein
MIGKSTDRETGWPPFSPYQDCQGLSAEKKPRMSLTSRPGSWWAA